MLIQHYDYDQPVLYEVGPVALMTQMWSCHYCSCSVQILAQVLEPRCGSQSLSAEASLWVREVHTVFAHLEVVGEQAVHLTKASISGVASMMAPVVE